MSGDTSNTSKDENNIDRSILLTKFLAGGVSAAVIVTLTAPLERTKLILQIQDRSTSIPSHKRYKGIIDCLTRIPKEQGFLSFWRGNTASVVRCFPNHAFNFSLKDVFRELAISKVRPNSMGRRMLINVITGGLAGAAALSIIYPLDYARTRLAMDIGNSKSTREFGSIRHCIKDAYESHGVRGLYRGYFVSAFGVMIYRAAYFGIYDTGTDFIPADLRTLWMQFLLAETSAIVAGLLSFPIDTVRRTLMMQSGKKPKAVVSHKTGLACAKSIYKTHGIGGFFRGALANVLRGTGGALMLIMYDNLNYLMLGDKSHNFHDKPVNLEESPHETLTKQSDESESDMENKLQHDVSRDTFCNF